MLCAHTLSLSSAQSSKAKTALGIMNCQGWRWEGLARCMSFTLLSGSTLSFLRRGHMNWLPRNWVIKSWFWVGISTVKTYNRKKSEWPRKNLKMKEITYFLFLKKNSKMATRQNITDKLDSLKLEAWNILKEITLF